MKTCTDPLCRNGQQLKFIKGEFYDAGPCPQCALRLLRRIKKRLDDPDHPDELPDDLKQILDDAPDLTL